jgi:hypothetical protein
MKISLYFAALAFLFGCVQQDEASSFYPKGEVLGYKPIYASEKDYNIEWQAPRSLQRPGKIYVYNRMLLINEKFAGIHLIDNSNPTKPQPIGFINIPGNIDMAITKNVLYADNQRDLVAIDLSDLSNLTVMKRFSNILPEYNLYPDEEERVFFECVETSKGIVIGWEKTLIKDPKCYR